MCILQVGLTSYLQNAMAFFTKIPPKFECRKEGSDEWHECTKSEICNEGISKDNYRPVESEDEYIDNWIE
jgi:hypothetical protein